MFEQDTIKHQIARSIVAHLMTNEYARFSEMRPNRVDTNLFTYHLKSLVKMDYVSKTDKGYTLTDKGLVYVDRVSSDKMKLRTQPKIITMLLVQDGYGKVLLQKRTKQPYINTWTLPYGKLHIDDESVLHSAGREADEKLNYKPESLRHVGDCYISVGHMNNKKFDIATRTLAHIVRFEADDILESDNLKWVKPLSLIRLNIAPAVDRIISRAFFGDEFFFEEFQIDKVK